MKFSNKDLILLFGILVAVIVALTTVVFTERSSAIPQTTENAVTPKASLMTPSDIAKKAIDKIEFKSLIR